jgi:predicted DCC family thiol-disulfide oxidoreductase YuxK
MQNAGTLTGHQTKTGRACLHCMESQIVFFDDYCVLCSRSVRFIYRNDRRGRFRFASFDSEAFRGIAGKLPEQFQVRGSGVSEASQGSVVLYRRGRVHLRSAAALRIAMLLRFPWPLLAAGLALPPFIRDAVYNLIARNRYRWFGKRETCFLPGEGLRERFLP